ncbi:hypothetical protein MASR2M78_28810 [Treponema sp.]
MNGKLSFHTTVKKYIDSTLSTMPFAIKNTDSDFFYLAYKGAGGGSVTIRKKNGMNAFSIHIAKQGAKFPAYPLRLVFLLKGNDHYANVFKHADDYFYYSNEEELCNTVQFSFRVLVDICKPFFEGKLSEEIDEYLKKVGESYSNLSSEEKKKQVHETLQHFREWMKYRLPDLIAKEEDQVCNNHVTFEPFDWMNSNEGRV